MFIYQVIITKGEPLKASLVMKDALLKTLFIWSCRDLAVFYLSVFEFFNNMGIG